jgi:CubicO group peptidase (beta-lactamase class C family)
MGYAADTIGHTGHRRLLYSMDKQRTKLVFLMALLQVERGIIKMDEPVQRLLPECNLSVG